VAALGKEISREYTGRWPDEVATVDRDFVFAALEPDDFGFRTASNRIWVGYGLAGPKGAGETTHSFLQDRTAHRGRVEKDGKRKHDRDSVRLPELERET
jgi:hypothetical protein